MEELEDGSPEQTYDEYGFDPPGRSLIRS